MTDAMYAAMMIPHHQMGIKLAQMAVDKAATDGVRQIAQQAVNDQQKELPTLQSIAKDASQDPMPPEDPLDAFDQEQMAQLQSLSGQDFDRKWLEVFRSHHMAAIMMSDIALSGTSGGDAKSVEQQIHDGQLKQVSTMNTLRQQLG